MVTGNYVRTTLKFKSAISNFFQKHKKPFFVCTMFLFFGFCFGVFIVVKNSNVIELNNMFDNNLKSIIKAERGVFGAFFPYLLLFSIIVSVCIFLNFKSWLMVFTFLAITVYGYIFGYNVAIMVVLFDTIGLLNAVIIIIPVEICISLVILIIASIAIYRCYIIKKYGCMYYQKCCWVNLHKVYLWWVICGVILVLLKSILFGVIRITIIV